MLDHEGKEEEFSIPNVKYHPDCPVNILSLPNLEKRGFWYYTDPEKQELNVVNAEGKIVLKGLKAKNGFYTVSYQRALNPETAFAAIEEEFKKEPIEPETLDSVPDVSQFEDSEPSQLETLDSKIDDPAAMAIELETFVSEKVSIIKPDSTDNSLALWHERLAHVSPHRIATAINDELVIGCNLRKVQHVKYSCTSCDKGKQKKQRTKFATSKIVSKPGTFLNADINVMPEQTWNKKKYCLAFSCEATSFAWPYLLDDRKNLLQWFNKIYSLIETQFGQKVQRIRCDNEFTQDTAFVEFCENRGIIMEPRPPFDSNQNAKAERRIQSIMNMTRCTLDAANAPNSLWGECMLLSHLEYRAHQGQSSTNHSMAGPQWLSA